LAEITVPAGAGFEALNNVLIGFYRAGAFETPTSNEDVSQRTGLSLDLITRNNGFFEELQILTQREGANHRLTEAGRDYAKFLHYGQLDDAKKVLARLMAAWEPIAKLLDMVELKGPLSRSELVAQIGMRAEVSISSPRYSTGVNALIEFMLFAGLIREGEEGIERIRSLVPEEGGVTSSVLTGLAKGGNETATQPEAAMGIELHLAVSVDSNTDPKQVAKIIRAIRRALREDLDETSTE